MRILERIKARLNSKKYENIISLGNNCEISFYFHRYYKFLDSSLFSWSFIPSLDNLLMVLDDFNSLLKEGLELSCLLFRCKKTGICFHGKSPMIVWQDKNYDEKLLENEIIELTSRINYLKEKFIRIASSSEKCLYIIKIPEVLPDTTDKILKIYQGLLSIGKDNFDFLVVVLEKDKDKISFDNPNIYVRTVKKYPPNDKVTDRKLGDKLGWKIIFDEFRPVHIKKKTKKFKFEQV